MQHMSQFMQHMSHNMQHMSHIMQHKSHAMQQMSQMGMQHMSHLCSQCYLICSISPFKSLSLSLSHSKVQFVNLSMSAICALGSSCNSLLSFVNDLHFDKTIKKNHYENYVYLLDLAITSSVVGISLGLTQNFLLFNFSIPSICLFL